MEEVVIKKDRQNILNRVSYALFFVSCAIFVSLQLISFIFRLLGLGKIISTDIIFLVSSCLAFFGICFLIVAKFSDIEIKLTKSKLKDNIEYIFLSFCLLWTLLATIFAIKPDIVWLGNSYNKEGFLSILGYGAIGVSAYLLKSEDRVKILKLFVLTSVIPATYLLFVNIFSLKALIPPPRSIYLNENHYGYALCVLAVVSAGFVLYDKKVYQKVFFSYCFTVINANLLVSDCFGAHIGQIVGLVVLFVIRIVETKKLKATILVIVGLMAISTTALEVTKITNISDDYESLFNDASDIAGGGASGGEGSGRYGLWEDTLVVIGKAPFFGKGLDCYYDNNIYADIDMPHNEYLQIASNVGIPCLVGYLAFLVILYAKTFKNIKRLKREQKIALSGSLAYLVSAFFGNTFIYTYPLLVIMIAFVARREKC